MPSPALDAIFKKKFEQFDFGGFVALAANAGHHLTAFGLGEDVGHENTQRLIVSNLDDPSDPIGIDPRPIRHEPHSAQKIHYIDPGKPQRMALSKASMAA